MATQYMIGVYNRYANLLDDTEDPSEILVNLQFADEKLDLLAKQTKKVPVNETSEKRQAKTKIDVEKDAAPPANNKSRKVSFGPKLVHIVQQEDQFNEDEVEPIMNSPDEFANKRRAAEKEYLKRTGKLNRTKVFYRGGGNAANRPIPAAGYEFDRHSNSLHSRVKPVDKRHGGGAHNWGHFLDDTNLSIEEESLDAPETLADTVPDETNAEETAGETEKNLVETEDNNATEKRVQQLTLQEWKALKGERQKPSFNLRKPGEGENYQKKWEQMVVVNKKNLENNEPAYEIIHCPQRVGRQKYLDIDIRFSKPAQRGRPKARGFRNGSQSEQPLPNKETEGAMETNESPPHSNGQNGAFRGRGRGKNNQRCQQAPQVDNEQDFPSLR